MNGKSLKLGWAMGIETLVARKSKYLRAACGTVRRALEAITTLNGLRGCTTGRAIFLRAMPTSINNPKNKNHRLGS